MITINNDFSCYPGRYFIPPSACSLTYNFKNRNWWTVPKGRPSGATPQNSLAYAPPFLWNHRHLRVPRKAMWLVIQRNSLYWRWFNALSLWRYSASLWTVSRVPTSLWRTDRSTTLRRSGRRRVRCVTNETVTYFFRQAHHAFVLPSSSCCISCHLSGTCPLNKSSKFSIVLPGITQLFHSFLLTLLSRSTYSLQRHLEIHKKTSLEKDSSYGK